MVLEDCVLQVLKALYACEEFRFFTVQALGGLKSTFSQKKLTSFWNIYKSNSWNFFTETYFTCMNVLCPYFNIKNLYTNENGEGGTC